MSEFPNIFVTGIGTEVGKTVCSAVLVKALQADYWKPVQAGELDFTDSMKVRQWASHPNLTVHPERHALQHPMSPHAAAELEDCTIHLQDFQLPQTQRPLVVEGAGGLMVPLNHSEMMVDLIDHLKLPVVLVCSLYLGSINHSLLSLECLKSRKLQVLGVIFNGASNSQSESVILKYSGVACLGRLSKLEQVNAETIENMAECLDLNLLKA